MPLPTPNAGETESDFVARCCADPGMIAEFPDADQRAAVCYRQFREAARAAAQSAEPTPPLRADARALPESPDAPIMYAPGGDHTAVMAYGPAAAEVTLRVGPETAAVLQASLEQALKAHAPQKPFFDKNHEAVEATAWPKRFFWAEKPAPGVYVEAELTALGRELIAGKVMRAFSPSFHSDAELPPRPLPGQLIRIPPGKRGSKENPARMTRIHFPDAGSLTNDPAFRQILPLWAKNAAGASSSDNDKNSSNMTDNEKGALQAKQKELEQTIATLKAGEQSAENLEALRIAQAELDSVKAQIEAEELKARNQELEKAILAQRERDAEAAIAAAIKRGAIPAKDEALQARWKKRLINDPEAYELLAAMKGSPALTLPRLTVSQVQVTQSDIREELKAYGRETDPLKRGALYARNISPRIKELADVPLKAADTYYTDIVVQRTLELLKYEFPVLSRITTDFSAENARLGQSVITRIVTPPAVADYHTTNGYVPQTTTTVDVSVTLSAHRHTTVKFDANVLASTFRNLFDEQLPAMQYSLGKDMVDTLYALITTANYTNTPVTEAVVDFDRSTVIDLGTSLTLAGVPLTGRTLLLNSTYYGALMSDEAIVNLAANQRAEIITGNRLPQIHGFEVIEAPNLPNTGNLAGFAFSRSAMLLVTRVPTDVSNAFPGVTGGAVSRVITNPDTGLSVLMIQHVAPQLGHAYLILAWLRGVAKGQVAAGTILRSAS